jgi:hypothetical protein
MAGYYIAVTGYEHAPIGGSTVTTSTMVSLVTSTHVKSLISRGDQRFSQRIYPPPISQQRRSIALNVGARVKTTISPPLLSSNSFCRKPSSSIHCSITPPSRALLPSLHGGGLIADGLAAFPPSGSRPMTAEASPCAPSSSGASGRCTDRMSSKIYRSERTCVGSAVISGCSIYVQGIGVHGELV